MLVALTYNQQLRFTMMGRRGMAINPERLLNIIEDTISEEIEKHAKFD